MLAAESWDLTAFQTLLGLMRMTTLPMGYTNEVQHFDRVIKKVLHRRIIEGVAGLFIDDVGVVPPTQLEYISVVDGVKV